MEKHENCLNMTVKELREDGFMNTVSGKKVSILNPTESQIDIDDIATGLAHNCRFGGQTKRFFSIAEHSLRVMDLVEDSLKPIALMHDASEGYFGDVITPIKILIPKYKKIELNLLKVIFNKYGLDFSKLPDVKPADLESFKFEFNCLFAGRRGLRYLSPGEAKQQFLEKFNEFVLK